MTAPFAGFTPASSTDQTRLFAGDMRGNDGVARVVSSGFERAHRCISSLPNVRVNPGGTGET